MNADFMISTAAKLMGLDPQVLQAQFVQLRDWNIQAVKSFDTRLRQLESNHAATDAKLDLILQHLGVKQHGTSGNGNAAVGQLASGASVASEHGSSDANGGATQ